MIIKNPNARELVKDNKIVLCNIKNGSFVRVTNTYFRYLERYLEENKGEFIEPDGSSQTDKNIKLLFDELCKIRYYISETAYDQELVYSYQVIYLSLTNRCNLRCKHCIASSCAEETDSLKTEEWKKIIDEVLLLNPEQINLTGGEPLMRPDFCELLIYLRQKYKGMITLSTNGLLLVAMNRIDIITGNVDAVAISLDGYDEDSCARVRGKGVFPQIISAIKSLKEAKVEKISVSMLVTKYTYGHEDKFYTLCRDLGVSPLLRRFVPAGRGMDNQNELLPPMEYIEKLEKKDLRCALCQPGIKELNVNENGDAYPCAPLSGNEYLFMGNLLNSTIKDIIRKPGWREQIEALRPWRMQQCKQCNVSLFCHSCINFMLGMQEDEENFNNYCKQQKQHLEKLLWG